MFRYVLLLSAVAACSPDLCGKVQVRGNNDPDPRLNKYRDPDGTLELAEVCGDGDGAFSSSREDLDISTLVFSPNVPDGDFDGDLAVGDDVLPAASVVFWNEHLVPGTTLTIHELGGSGLRKQNLDTTYDLYALVGGTLKVVSGKVGDHTQDGWQEIWKLEWSLDFGTSPSDVVMHFQGNDEVHRYADSPIGTLPNYPPDPKPM